MSRVFITIISMLAMFFTADKVAMACSAPGQGPSAERVGNADIAFIGLVVKTRPVRFKKYSDMQVTTFKVAKSIRGNNSRKITIKHSTSSSACGMHFAKGEYYIVAGNIERGKLTLNNHTARKVRENSPYSFKRIRYKRWLFW